MRTLAGPCRHVCRTLAPLLACALGASASADRVPTAFATGLNGPIKLDITAGGNLLVAERGSGANDGRLSVVDRSGNVRPLLTGLPSGLEVLGQPSGPTAVEVDGCCFVELAIGEGNTLRFDPPFTPPIQIPNPEQPVSPILSSVLRLVFNRPLDKLTDGFTLAREDHDRLADGRTVRLENAAGDAAWVSLLADLKDFRPDLLTNVRGSNPFGMTAERGGAGFLLVDGGSNSIMRVGWFGPPRTLLRFAPIKNPPNPVAEFADAVPTSVRHLDGSRYLVTLFAGLPFAPGTSSVRLVDVSRRREAPLITQLTSAIDVLPLRSGIYVLEHSENVFAGRPTGRLLRFATPSSAPQVIASGLNHPTSMVYSARYGAFFITELNANRISRIDH